MQRIEDMSAKERLEYRESLLIAISEAEDQASYANDPQERAEWRSHLIRDRAQLDLIDTHYSD